MRLIHTRWVGCVTAWPWSRTWGVSHREKGTSTENYTWVHLHVLNGERGAAVRGLLAPCPAH